MCTGGHRWARIYSYSLGYNRAPIGNCKLQYGVSNGHMTDDVGDRWSVNHDLGMFGREIGSLEKSHGIGQTPCSYEHYRVKEKI